MSFVTYLSGGLSTRVVTCEGVKGGDRGEGGGTAAGLALGVVGDCGLSHWTMGDRVWLELRVQGDSTGLIA